MNIKQIETFYWAAKLGSFKAAASYLNATQSTISTRIQELEEFFGVALFDRSRRVVRLTDKGRELLVYAERFVALSEEMQASISETDSVSGTVRIGVSEVISATWLPKFIKAVKLRYPKLAAEYDVTSVINQLDKLKRGDLDLLLLPRRSGQYGHQIRSIGQVAFKWCASRDFAFPAPPPLTAVDFIDLPVIALHKESNNWQTIESWLSENGGYAKKLTQCNRMDVVLAMTLAGQGLGLFPVCSYQNEIANGSLVLVETNPSVPLVEFAAVSQNDQPRLPIRLVAELAAEISEFTETA
ncbi:MAG: LysR family transcriptional regulator [Acidobacteriota bacterium]